MAAAMPRGARKHATNRRARALGVLVIALLTARAVAPAHADERVVLVLDTTGDAEGRAMADRFERSLGPDPTLDPVPERYRRALREPTFTDTSWQAAAAEAVAARKLLAPSSYAQARTRARLAQDRLAAFAGEPAARALLAELVLIEGLAVAGESGADAARPLFGLVHRLQPGQTLDPGRYLPEVVKAFAAAAISGASGKLVIDASGAEQILVDGVVTGGGETVVVAAGPHIVSVRGERIDPEGRRVESVAGKDVVVSLTTVEARTEVLLGRARDRLIAAADDQVRIDALSVLLARTGTRHAVVIVRERGALATRIFTAPGGLGPARRIDDVAGALAPLRPIAVKPRGGPGERRDGGVGPGPVRPPEPLPWWRTTWFKATSGTVATVVTVALVTAIVTRDPGSSTLQSGVDVE